MRPIINGSLQPIRTSLRATFDPSKGITVTQDYESAGDNLGGLAQQCLASKMQYDHTPNQRRSKLVFSATGPAAGFGEVAIDTWQLLANEQQKDIKEHPQVLLMERTVPYSLAAVLEAVEDYNDFQTIDATWFTDTDIAGRLFRMLIHGVTSYNVGQYVLRHTTNVSNVYDTNVADQNVERIYTTGELVTEICNTGYWLFPCPGRLRRKIEDMEVQTSDADLLWGWRKLPSTETTAAGNRIDISTEYWLAGWSTLLYSGLS
jgi:hypothetical protein